MQQLNDGGLHADVERGRDLIADQHRWLADQRPGDCHSLALATGQLIGKTVGVGGGERHPLEHLGDPAIDLVALDGAKDFERLADDLTNRATRVERPVGVLEDVLDGPANLAWPGARDLCQGRAVEVDDAPAIAMKPGDRPGQRCLS